MRKIILTLFFMIASACAATAVCSAQEGDRNADAQISMVADAIDAPAYDQSIAQEFSDGVSDASAVTMHTIWGLMLRFAFNLLVCFVIIQFFYYPKGGRRDYYFTLLIFSSAMFLLLFVMNNLSLEIGFTLGLFAIFGMIRYRTESVPVREMTYLFSVIAVAIINGIGALLPFTVIVVVNLVLVAVIAVVELVYSRMHSKGVKLVIYDRIELITPDKRNELIADLKARTGLDIVSVEIGQIDFLKDSAWIKVHYILPSGEDGSLDSLDKPKNFQT